MKKPEEEEPAPVIEEPKEEEKPKKPEIPEREPEEYEWKCPNCGKINQNYVGTCGCGAAKPNDKLFNWAEVHPDLVQKPARSKSPLPSSKNPKRKRRRRKKSLLQSVSPSSMSGSAPTAARSIRTMSAPAAAAHPSPTISCSTGRRFIPI